MLKSQIFLKRIGLVFLTLFFLIDALAAVAFWQYDFISRPRVIFFDVGQGDSIFIDLHGNNQILIDGGSGKGILDKLGKYMPFYDKKIELLVMTHPDKDHMGGLVEVLKYYKVDRILQTGIECETGICGEWDGLATKKNISVEYAEFGQTINVGEANINVLYPFENLKGQTIKNDNDTSIVLKVIIKNKSIKSERTAGEYFVDDGKRKISKQDQNDQNNSYLLTGDAGFKVEKDLLGKNINLQSGILKVSHHGSRNSTSDDFLKAVKPGKSIISVGKNSYGHPAEELMDRLKNINSEILRTDKIGDLAFY